MHRNASELVPNASRGLHVALLRIIEPIKACRERRKDTPLPRPLQFGYWNQWLKLELYCPNAKRVNRGSGHNYLLKTTRREHTLATAIIFPNLSDLGTSQLFVLLTGAQEAVGVNGRWYYKPPRSR